MLPIVRAAGFEVRANAYVVGYTRRVATLAHNSVQGGGVHGVVSASPSLADERDRSPGCQGGVTDLWYLSLVGARGQGTSLRAVWANLVSNHNHGVWLEGVGSVTLGHHRLDLAGLGYSIHWTYRQAVLPPSRDVQGVLESDLLTCHDPQLVPHAVRGRPWRATRVRTQGGGSGKETKNAHPVDQGRSERTAGNKAEGGAVTLTTVTSGAEDADETAAREAMPLFLLLVPDALSRTPTSRSSQESGMYRQDEWLARLHLRYLAARISWLPYYPAWATYLWQRARERGEAEALYVWCYREPTAEEADAAYNSVHHTQSVESPGAAATLTAAYLCRPDPLALTADLSRTIAGGTFRVPASPGRLADSLAA